MKSFEYEVTHYPAESYQELVFVCSNQGACRQDKQLADQTGILVEQLNGRGREGWELVQLSFGQQGIAAFWKRQREE